MRTKRLVRALGFVWVMGVACLAGIAQAAEEAAQIPPTQPPAESAVPIESGEAVSDSAQSCEAAPMSTEAATADDLAGAEAGGPGCKPCKGRTWCKCTYNGIPRSTCDPCCYVNDIGVMICLD